MTLFFFDKKNASISGRLVEDSNRDFTEIAADGGFELGFDGVRVELLNSSGHVIATTFTDHSGRYTFRQSLHLRAYVQAICDQPTKPSSRIITSNLIAPPVSAVPHKDELSIALEICRVRL